MVREETVTEKVWLASSDDEQWSDAVEFKTREEAIEAAPDELSLATGEKFFTGWKEAQSIDDLVTRGMADMLAERIYESELEDVAVDVCPSSEGWLQLTDDEAEELAGLLSEAVKKFIEAHPKHMPSWFIARDVEEHEVPMRVEDKS